MSRTKALFTDADLDAILKQFVSPHNYPLTLEEAYLLDLPHPFLTLQETGSVVDLLANLASIRVPCEIYTRPEPTWMDMDERTFRRHFRFDRQDIPRLCDLLLIPNPVIGLTTRCVASPEEALVMLLLYYGHSYELYLCEQILGCSAGRISDIVATLATFLHTKWARCLAFWPGAWDRMDEYRDSFRDLADDPNYTCFASIDGTTISVHRPKKGQSLVYNGYYHDTCLKVSCITLADGIMNPGYDVFSSRVHDGTAVDRSGVLDLMDAMFGPDNQDFMLAGDLAYHSSSRSHIVAPYHIPPGCKELPEFASQVLFNETLSSLRIGVEWSFGKWKTLFQRFATKQLSLLKSDCTSPIFATILLTNCHTCLYGGIVSSYFGRLPPELEEYLNPLWSSEV